MRPPEKSEYSEYYQTYVGRVPDRSVLDVLSEAPPALASLFASVAVEDERFAYAPGKWTMREVLGHVLDTERVFGYRALHIARADPADLPGMDQDVWAGGSNARDRPLTDQLDEFRGLRSANALLFRSFDDEVLARSGVASGVRFTVRSLVFIVAGHEIHHRRVLEDRYLTPLMGEGRP